MNIYPFLGLEEANNLKFVDELLSFSPFQNSQALKRQLLALIEGNVKNRLGNIILLEKQVAVMAELVTTEDEFINTISRTEEWQDYFFEEYPILKTYLEKEYEKVKVLIETAFTRLYSDFKELELDAEDEIKKFDIGEGDFHDGTCTCKFMFKSGKSIYYKPRSLAIDIEMLQFFIKFEKIINKQLFYPVHNINKGNYGWSIGVPVMDCKTAEEIKIYYENIGVFTAVAHALKIEDIIYDNLIVVGNKIALIDLECCMATEFDINSDVSYILDSIAGKKYRNSVINSGIIPRHTFEGREKDGESDAVLSYLSNRRLYNKTQTVVDNEIRIKKEEATIDSEENHVPKLVGVSQPVKLYISDFLSGFEFGYYQIIKHKSVFYKFLADSLEKKLETRIIYRPTKIYATVLQESFHVDYLKSSENRDKLFNFMYNAADVGVPNEVIKSEIEQLENNDVPAFRKYFGKNEVFAFSGESLGIKYAEISDIEQVRTRLNEFGDDDYKTQRKTIIASLNVFDEVNIPSKVPNFTKKSTNTVVFDQPLVENFIHDSIHFLKDQLFIDDKSASVLDVFSNVNNGWRFGPIGPGLGNGTDGLAAVFAGYGKIFNNSDFINVAKKIIEVNAKAFDNLCKKDSNFSSTSHFPFSAFQFPTSTVYTHHLFNFLTNSDAEGPYNLKNNIINYFKKWLHKDEHFDLIIGSAGAILLFYQLYKNEKEDSYKKIVEDCANHLIKNSKEIEPGKICWNTNKFIDLGGFSHGTSSYSLALLLAYDLLGDKVYFDAFEKALAYDRSLLDPEHNKYLDHRYAPEKVFSHAWAHGSAGIGLSRLMMTEIVPDYYGLKKEIELCRDLTEQYVNYGDIYAVNGGFAGNVEVLRMLNNYCAISNDKVDQCIVDRISSIANNPSVLVREKNSLHLLFNQGLTGLVYSLLRAISPTEIPSILTLGTSTKFGPKHLYI